MLAKQTIVSASLGLAVGLAIGGRPATIRADPDPSTTSPDTETGKAQIGSDALDERVVLTGGIAQTSLFAMGDSVSLSGGSGLRDLFQIGFVQPHMLGTNFTLDTQLYSSRALMPGFTRDAVGGSMTATHRLSRHVRGYIGYHLEQASGEPDTIARPTTAPAIDRTSALRAGIGYDSRDSVSLPTRGTDVGVGVEVANPLLGSQFAFSTLEAWAGTNQRVGPVIVHLAGSFTALEGSGAIPLADRLFTMGATDVRGYMGAFGPVDPEGNPIGGTVKLVGHGSVELPLCGAGVSLEGFFDYAQIWDTSAPETLRLARLVGRSVGFGVIWRSPLVPVHLDVALPLVSGASPVLTLDIGWQF